MKVVSLKLPRVWAHQQGSSARDLDDAASSSAEPVSVEKEAESEDLVANVATVVSLQLVVVQVPDHVSVSQDVDESLAEGNDHSEEFLSAGEKSSRIYLLELFGNILGSGYDRAKIKSRIAAL